MSLLAELKRRHVFKVGGAYVVIAWLLVQVASIAFPALEAPSWVHSGESAHGLTLLQDKPITNDRLPMGELFAPPPAEVRRLSEFSEFLRPMGLAAHWTRPGRRINAGRTPQSDYHCD